MFATALTVALALLAVFVVSNRFIGAWKWGPGALLLAAQPLATPICGLATVAVALAVPSPCAAIAAVAIVIGTLITLLGAVWFLAEDGGGSLADEEHELSVTAANIFGKQDAATAVAADALAAGDSVIALLEVSKIVADSVDGLLEGYERAVDHPNGGTGVVIWTRLAHSGARVVTLTDTSESVAGVVEVTTSEGRQVTVIAAHPTPPKFTPKDGALHAAEMAALGDLTNTVDGSVVLVGDLNAGAHSPSFMNLLRNTGLVDAHRIAGNGQGRTWGPGGRFTLLRLDHILTSPDLEPLSMEVREGHSSDHKPVTARIVGGVAARGATPGAATS